MTVKTDTTTYVTLRGSMVICVWAFATTKSRNNTVSTTRPVLGRRFWLALYMGKPAWVSDKHTNPLEVDAPFVPHLPCLLMCDIPWFPDCTRLLDSQEWEGTSSTCKNGIGPAVTRAEAVTSTLSAGETPPSCASILQRRYFLNYDQLSESTKRNLATLRLRPTKRTAKVRRTRLDSSRTGLSPSRTLATPG
jgi:hypothetical protein